MLPRPLLQQAIGDRVASAIALAYSVNGENNCIDLGSTSQVDTAENATLFAATPVGPNTVFDLASLTKPMATLTLLAQLLSEQTLRLEDTLERHLPLARNTPLGSATIGQLVSHTSGAPAWLDFYAATAAVASHRVEEIQHRVLNTPLTHRRGTVAVYSDLGYMSMGWMLEAVLGQPLNDAFALRIAQPLQISAHFRPSSQNLPPTDVVATEIWPPRCPDGSPLRGAVHDDNAAALGGVAGHAGLFSSSRDVLRWAQAWLAAISWDHQSAAAPLGLSREVCRRLVATAGCDQTSWRHGWDTPTQPGSSAGDRAPTDTFGHLGFTGTSVWISPQHGICIVLLTNRVHPTRDRVGGIRALRPALHDCLWQLLL